MIVSLDASKSQDAAEPGGQLISLGFRFPVSRLFFLQKQGTADGGDGFAANLDQR